MTPRRRKEWFDDDEFWQDVYPFLFPETSFVNATEQVRHLLGLVRPKGQAVLDLCCGPGRCALALAEKGYAVTGVDRTKFFLNKGRMRARQAGLTIEWVQADMRDFVREGAFDLALSYYTSFGYFQNPREDEGVLRNMLASLRPGGACVIDVVGKERLARVFAATTSMELPNGGLLVQRHEVIDDWTRIRNRWVVIRKGRAKNYAFDHRVYSGQELRTLMQNAGFADVRLYGNVDGRAYGPDATRLVAVGRRSTET